MISLLSFRAIDDLDTFCQIKAGEVFFSQKKFLTTEYFSYLHLGQQVANPGWLAQVLFYFIYQLGTWSALRWFHNIIFVLPFLIAAISLPSQEKDQAFSPSLVSITAGVMLGFLTSLSSSNLRPQDFALLGFSLMIYIIRSERLTLAKVLTCVTVAIFWQNCHPSIILGVLAALLTVIEQWLERKLFWRKNTSWGLVLVFLLSVSQFATPEGWHINSTAGANLSISRNLLHISEWQPPWDPSVINAMYPYWLALFITGLCLIASPGSRTRHLIFILPFTTLTFYAARFAPFWAIAMIPIWISFFEQLKPLWFASSPSALKASANLCLGVIILGTLLMVSSIFLSPSSKEILHAKIPLTAIEFLKEKVPSGRIYNYREWGGALIFYGYPQWQVAIDGRLYLYSEQEWKEHYQAALGLLNLDELVSKHQPQAFFIHKGFQKGLVNQLDLSPAWEKAFSQDQCLIYLPRNPPQEVISK